MTRTLATLVSALAFSWSSCIAGAAEQPMAPVPGVEQPTAPVDSAVLKRLAQSVMQKLSQSPQGNSAAGAPVAGYIGADLSGIGNLPIGLITFHAFNCIWFTDGTNNFEFVVSPEGFVVVVANNIFVAQTFLTGCVNGFFEQVNVINSSGAFNEVITFPFR